ncbi:MAG TPA: helix-turn-helix domain-containing protein [Acidimicrobiia bacterium]|nr:helix-turn-helix domain-containing protein [Acidimicrobiia bacterium]
MDVVILRWPSDRHRRNRLVADRAPRLLLVEPGAEPPRVTDCLEDWVRLPAADADIEMRTETLAFRRQAHRASGPHLGSDGTLRSDTGRVALSPLEARLVSALLERVGAVVGRHTLARAGWPGEARDRNALDVQMLRIRRKVETVGFTVRTVRSRGYVLEPAAGTASDSGQQTVADR